MTRAFVKNFLGSKQVAEEIAHRTYKLVPAYKRFLDEQGKDFSGAFDQLPLSDKKSYALAYPYQELLAESVQESFAIFRSSGSSGNSFYWPQLKSDYLTSHTTGRRFLENTFAIHEQKTLAIQGLALGGWIGGESTSLNLKNAARNAPYPFWVYSPGNNLDEIIQIIFQWESIVDQIILFIVPSAINHLHLKASQLGRSLPLKKLRYLVGGEPFTENIRISLQQNAGVEETSPFMLSSYASGDTGSIGTESLATVAIRTLLYRNNALATSLGIESPIPHFFHLAANNTFLEIVDNYFCVTRWQGIPLVRYVLYDQVALYSWKELKQAILTSDILDSQDDPWVTILSNASDELPDLIAVTGRADSCLIISGANLMEYMLDAAVKSEELKNLLTGIYRAQIFYESDRQYLKFDLELQVGIEIDTTKDNLIYHSLLRTLGQLEPSFLGIWKNVYSAWDNDPEKRVIRLNFLPWPSLSQSTEKAIKQRGIIKG